MLGLCKEKNWFKVEKRCEKQNWICPQYVNSILNNDKISSSSPISSKTKTKSLWLWHGFLKVIIR